MSILAELHLDEKGYKSKPQTYSGAISNRITSKVTTVTPLELAESLTTGHTALCGLMEGKRKKGNLKSQALVMLDFDNSKKVNGEEIKYTGSDYKTFAEVKNHPFIQANASFLYRTFSSTSNHEKFRVVFFLSQPLSTEAQVSHLYTKLFELFPQVDSACSDSSRLFFGGVSYEEVNFNNVYEVPSDVLEAVSAPVKEKPTDTDLPVEIGSVDFTRRSESELVEHLLNGDISAIRQRFSKQFGKKVPSIAVALEYLRRLPIRELFDLPSEGAFFDLLHEESSPSATVFEDFEGRQRYFCHSSSCPFDGDFIALTMKITGQSFHSVVTMLTVSFNIEIEKSDEEKYIYNTLDILISALRDKKVLKESYEYVYRVFARDRALVANILSLIRDYTLFDYETGTVRCAIIMGQRRIAEMVGASRPAVGRVLKKMESVGMIETLGEEDIPKAIYKMLIRSKSREYRYHLNITAIPQSADFISEVADRCYHSQRTGGLVKGSLTRKATVINNGNDRAKELFKQDVENIDKGVLSKSDKANQQKLLKIVEDLMATNGYVIEKDLPMALRRATNYKKNTWDADRIKGVRGMVLDTLGLELVKVTKVVREKLGVEIGYNTIIYVRKGF